MILPTQSRIRITRPSSSTASNTKANHAHEIYKDWDKVFTNVVFKPGEFVDRLKSVPIVSVYLGWASNRGLGSYASRANIVTNKLFLSIFTFFWTMLASNIFLVSCSKDA